jgi:hypothetical protein
LEELIKPKVLTLVAVMAALSNIFSTELFSIPFAIGPFVSRIHFTQLPIFIGGSLAGPLAGFLTGAVGGLYMSATAIPFIIGGLGLLGFSTGFISKRLRIRPFFSCILAWGIQSVYVFVTDYVWFRYFTSMPNSVVMGIVTTILIKLTIEAIISSFLAEVIVYSIRRTGLISTNFFYQQ